MTSLLDVIYEWQNNPKFREEFKKNPTLAVKNAGFELAKEDFDKIVALANLDKSKNEKLDDRINK